jgi:hypothetical protein
MGRGYCVGMVVVWQGLVLPAIPSTSLRAITPRQGAGVSAGVFGLAP